MAFRFYWMMGFGISSVIIIILLLLASLYFKGIAAGVSITLLAISLIITCYRFYHWNGNVRRRIHGRGMLLFSMFAGEEMKTAKQEGRPYSIKNSCLHLARSICGEGKMVEATVMVNALEQEKGLYLIKLLQENIKYVLPNIDKIMLNNLFDIAHKLDLCPQLVIANVIENTYGPVEATKYALDILTGSAK